MTARGNPCHLHQPEIYASTGFIFICPGRYEEKECRPCSGQTGQGLKDGLAHLHRLRPDWFPSADRYDYLITNAWDRVEYKAKTGRSMPTSVEVAVRRNVERLYSEIARLDRVIACGEQAHLAVHLCTEFLGYSGVVAYAPHTSRQALGCPNAAAYEGAIQRWAEGIIGQLEAAPNRMGAS
jgi:hypothetical protein